MGSVFSLCVYQRRYNQRKTDPRMGAGLCEVPTKKGFSSDPLNPDPVGGPHSTPAKLLSPEMAHPTPLRLHSHGQGPGTSLPTL